MTPEHKAKVMAGLAKARAASALARSKKSEVKKIKKANENEERDEIIRKDLLKKTQKSDEKDKRIAELEKKLASLTLQDVVKKPRKVKVIDTDNAPLIARRDEPEEPVACARTRARTRTPGTTGTTDTFSSIARPASTCYPKKRTCCSGVTSTSVDMTKSKKA